MGPNGSGKSTLATTLLGSPEYEVTGGRILLQGRRHHRLGHRGPRQGRPVPRLPVPAAGAGRVGDQLPAPGPVGPQGHRPLGARAAAGDHGVDGPPRHGPVLRRPVPQRGLLRRREEAQRDPPDGDPRARGRRSSTRPTPASTSTPSRSWPRACRRCGATGPSSASSPSRTTSACSTTSSPTSCTSSSTAASSPPAAWSSPSSSSARATRRSDVTPRRRRRQEGLPDPRARGARQAPRLPRLGQHVAEAAGRARRHGALLRALQRQRAPRRLPHRRGGHRRPRGRPRQGRPLHRRRRTAARSCSPRTPPRRSTSSPRPGAGPTSRAGDAVVLTELEHHANIVPWHQLHDELGVELRWIPVQPDGHLDLTDLDRLVDGAKLVTFTAMSNVLGTLLPVERLVGAAHAAGAIAVVDAVPVRPPPRHRRAGLGRRLRRLHRPQDAAAPPASACCGAPSELLEAMPPFLAGGEMILNVTKEGFTPNELPWKFEAGTPPIAEAVGLGAAVDYLDGLGMDAVREHEVSLTAYALRSLAERFGDDLTIHGPSEPAERGGVLSLHLRRHPPARPHPGARRARRVRAGRPPLRQAADARARRRRHRPGLPLRLQRRGRRRRARPTPSTPPPRSSPI